MSDVAEGLEYLHSCSVTHADIKMVRDVSIELPGLTSSPIQENVLIDEEGRAQLCDMGMARIKDQFQKASSTIVDGCFSTLAPEMLKMGAASTTKTDVWAFACLVIQVRHRSLFTSCLLTRFLDFKWFPSSLSIYKSVHAGKSSRTRGDTAGAGSSM